MLNEMSRVARYGGTIRIVCPHRFASRRKKPLHRNPLNLSWFAEAFQKLGLEIVQAGCTGWRCFPHSFVPVARLPAEVQVIGRKLGIRRALI
jgi:hypothetical protein